MRSHRVTPKNREGSCSCPECEYQAMRMRVERPPRTCTCGCHCVAREYQVPRIYVEIVKTEEERNPWDYKSAPY